MDDLISRKVAIEEFEDMVTSVSVYGESAEARYATNARIRFVEKLNSIPTVPAVPLDKLCEWLAGNAWHLDCTDCDAEHCDCPQWHDDSGSLPAFWKAKLTKWMEEQDAAD